ncbi:MAG: SMP-30/gluconolactonase/LRE family protein, partial [Actinomycetes bacterium]
WALPDKVQPKPEFLIRTLAVDPTTGEVVHDFGGEDRDFGVSTGVREHDGTVWLGSLTAGSIAAFALPG